MEPPIARLSGMVILSPVLLAHLHGQPKQIRHASPFLGGSRKRNQFKRVGTNDFWRVGYRRGFSDQDFDERGIDSELTPPVTSLDFRYQEALVQWRLCWTFARPTLAAFQEVNISLLTTVAPVVAPTLSNEKKW